MTSLRSMCAAAALVALGMVPTQVFAMATEQGAPGMIRAPEIEVAPNLPLRPLEVMPEMISKKVAAIYLEIDGITGSVATQGFEDQHCGPWVWGC